MSPAPLPLAHERPDTDVLVRRATFGPDGEVERTARVLGWDAFLERQLRPESIPDDALEGWLESRFPESALSPKDALTLFQAPARSLREAALLRAFASKRQVFERAVEFWNDHFHVDVGSGECRVLKAFEDRSAIRSHALGRFRDLIEAVARSAAMLEYLDNRRNVKAAPNENYARELLELHTLGVGEYGERDVREVARCFTGWSMRSREDERFAEFVFDADEHDDGEKTVLGRTIPARGGQADGKIVLDLVARHPATGRRIARAMCARFVAESPPDELVEAVACAFSESDGDLRATLRAALSSERFATGLEGTTEARSVPGPVARPKFRRPFHLVVATLRATRATIADASGLLDELETLGDASFGWPTPDGPPDRRDWWESSLLSRWRFLERYARGEISGVSFDVDALLAQATAADVVGRLDACLTGGRMSATDRAVLQEHADALSTRTTRTSHVRSLAPLDEPTRRRMLALAACSPSFQVA